MRPGDGFPVRVVEAPAAARYTHSVSVQPQSPPATRRAGLLALVMLAIGLLVVVFYVLVSEQTADELDVEITLTEPPVDTSRPPAFTFPTTMRTYDTSLNAFVDRFARACLTGRYSEVRKLFTRRIEPPSDKAFVTMFNAVRSLRIESLDRLPPLKSFDGPVYRLVAECTLQDFAVKHGPPTRRVQVGIIQENGDWALTPLPRGSAEQLDALLSGATQPAAFDDDDAQ